MAQRHQSFLRLLGARLRAVRERRSLGVGEVAQLAGVSRRYLTEAEAGRANPSIELLLRLAQALGVRLAELVDLPLRPPSERVALVGLRGAGKSSVGRRLALSLEVPFVELDERVEELAGLELGEIFALHGEEGFRRFEAEALEDVLAQGGRSVLAVGGSIVESPSFERLRATCRTVWLRASPDAHFERVLAQGDDRPMRQRPRARQELEALLERRSPLYALAEVEVDTTAKDVAAVECEVRERLFEADEEA